MGGAGEEAVLDWFDTALHLIARGFEAAGVAVIVVGALVATAKYALRVFGETDRSEAYHLFRTSLARAILLGLEFLVAADIIGTVAVEPTLQNLAVLALIVAIRTFLSFSLELEVSGRWPWQKARERSGDKDRGARV